MTGLMAENSPLLITHLGPSGTYTEQAACFYLNWLQTHRGITASLSPCSTIAQCLHAVSTNLAKLAVVPVENSIEGSVTMTMDTLWQLDRLEIQLALILPISHNLISCAANLESIQTVYSHPQALGQCQAWLAQFLPNVQILPSTSTTAALEDLTRDLTAAAIASTRAAELYNLPILASCINDRPENFTRFWIISLKEDESPIKYSIDSDKSYTSLAFSLPANIPGGLVKALEVFANLGINLSRIESRPTKRLLGEYLFFLDLEANVATPLMQTALKELNTYAELIKIFGSYSVLPVS